ncbi:MAG: hypothetical protein H0U67_03910, partial [Gemmatimonadetes bacterium]|nr:hypothetical protein [Gemmatimonadota bacterium]
IAHAGVIVLLTAGAVVLWRLWRPAVLYLVAYVALIILWPWTRADYLTALVPLLVTAILLGAHGIAQRIDPRWGLPALVGMALVLVIFGSARTARIIAQQGNCEWASYLAPGPCQAMGSYFAAARHIAGALPEEAVLLTAEPYRLYYLSGRRSVSYERMLEYTAEEFVDGMREAGVQYILLGRAHTPDYSNLPDLLYANCESLVLEASFHPTTHLFRLAEPVEVGADDTPCRVLRGYAEPLQPLAGG